MESALEKYTAGFYNSLVTAMRMSNQEFQLVQGVQPILPTDTSPNSFNNFLDGVPPVTVGTLYTANPINKFSGNYDALFDYQKPEGRVYQRALTNFDNPNFWLNSKGVPPGTAGINPEYHPSPEEAIAATRAGGSIKWMYDSATADSNIQNSWAKTTDSAGVWFWGTDSSSEAKSCNTKATSSKITVEVSIDRFAIVPVQMGGWYYAGFFSKAYTDKNSWIDPNNWNLYFGPQGNTQRMAVQVLVATGITQVVTSHTTYTTTEYEFLRKDKNVNVFPFYNSREGSSTERDVRHNADQTISVEMKTSDLSLLGLNVLPMSTLMGAQTTLIARNH